MTNLLTKIPSKYYSKYKGVYPFPVINLARDLGLSVYETTDLDENEAGLIRKEDGKYVIYINAHDPSTRKRFTIAHEIGHYLLHKKDLDNNNEFIDHRVQPYSNTMYRDTSLHNNTNTKEKQKEIEANRFAAALLMPDQEFRKVFKKADTIDTVAQYFKVSPSAASIRAKELLNMVMW